MLYRYNAHTVPDTPLEIALAAEGMKRGIWFPEREYTDLSRTAGEAKDEQSQQVVKDICGLMPEEAQRGVLAMPYLQVLRAYSGAMAPVKDGIEKLDTAILDASARRTQAALWSLTHAILQMEDALAGKGEAVPPEYPLAQRVWRKNDISVSDVIYAKPDFPAVGESQGPSHRPGALRGRDGQRWRRDSGCATAKSRGSL